MEQGYRVANETETWMGMDMYFVVDSNGKKVTSPAGIIDGLYGSGPTGRETAQRVADGLNAGKTPEQIKRGE